MLGSCLVELLLGEGVAVTALVRPGSDLRFLHLLEIPTVQGELSDQTVIQAAVANSQLVFHVAAYFNLGSTFGVNDEFERYKAANIDLTKALLSASLEAGVGRFVYTSSASVYGPNVTAPVNENAKLNPATNYGRSKLLAEDCVRAYQARGLATTIVRPGLIYGPRDRYLLPAFARLRRVPVLPLPDKGCFRVDLVYVRDVAELMYRASQSEMANGKIYNAASGSPVALRELVTHYSAHIGRKTIVVGISTGVLRRISILARGYLKLFAPGLEVMLSPTGLAFMSRDMYFDMTRARDDLGFQSNVEFKHGLELVAADLTVKA